MAGTTGKSSRHRRKRKRRKRNRKSTESELRKEIRYLRTALKAVEEGDEDETREERLHDAAFMAECKRNIALYRMALKRRILERKRAKEIRSYII